MRNEAASLPSLTYFNPHFMSLTKPHPMWTTCANNSYEVCKAIIQAKMLSGRFRTEKFKSHHTDNKKGICLICTENEVETLEHLLLFCSSLDSTRHTLINNFNYCIPSVKKFVIDIIAGKTKLSMQLLLDCSSIPEVIQLIQVQG